MVAVACSACTCAARLAKTLGKVVKITIAVIIPATKSAMPSDIYTPKADTFSQYDTQRNEYHDLAHYGKAQRRGGLSEGDIDVLQCHLHKKHNGTHQKERCVLDDDLPDGFACVE